MDERELRDLIKVWYHRSKREDSISKFVFLWFCFNAMIAFESGKETDRQMINWLKTRPTKSRLSHAFDEALGSDVFESHVKGLVLLSPITDPRGKHRAVVIASHDDFGNIVEGIYRVRCNLFHGAKHANDVRDQKLVSVSGTVLNKWVGNVLAAWTVS